MRHIFPLVEQHFKFRILSVHILKDFKGFNVIIYFVDAVNLTTFDILQSMFLNGVLFKISIKII